MSKKNITQTLKELDEEKKKLSVNQISEEMKSDMKNKLNQKFGVGNHKVVGDGEIHVRRNKESNWEHFGFVGDDKTHKKLNESENKKTENVIGIDAEDKSHETENEENSQTAILNKKIKDVGVPKEGMKKQSQEGTKQSAGKDQEKTDEENEKIRDSGAKAEDMKRLNFKEDIDAMFSGETLSEEFKNKALTIFETAVNVKVKAEVKRLEEEQEVKLEEQIDAIRQQLIEHVDGYLKAIAEEWLEENQQAVDSGLKLELAEDFMFGLKDLFVKNSVEITEEKVDVLEQLEEKIVSLEEQYNKNLDRTIELVKENATLKRAEIVRSLSEGLNELDAEKFKNLVEGLNFETEEDFTDKAKSVKESYFKSKVPSSKTDLSESTEIKNDVDNSIGSIYSRAMKKETY